MIKALRRKFVLITMALLSLVMGVVATVFITTTQSILYEGSVSVLQRVIAETETPSWGTGTNVSLPYFTVVIDPFGGATLTSSQFYSLDDRDYLLSAVNAALEQEGSLGLLEDYDLRYLRSASLSGWKLAFVDISYERSTLALALRGTVAITLLALAVFFLLSLALSKWAAAPAERAWEQQRKFVADASHELKTPLTVIRSNAELLEGAQLTDREDRWLRNISQGGARMSALVEELLLLARSEGDESRENHQPVDLSDLVQSAALMLEAAAFEAGRQLSWEGVEPGLTVLGDRKALEKLVDALLENALQYSDPGGWVRVSLTREGRRARLEVSDRGAPIPESELEAIFHRFYRGDPSRSGSGFGLGLSIARSVAQSHGGKLWAQSDPSGINTFFCSLPLSEGSSHT